MPEFRPKLFTLAGLYQRLGNLPGQAWPQRDLHMGRPVSPKALSHLSCAARTLNATVWSTPATLPLRLRAACGRRQGKRGLELVRSKKCSFVGYEYGFVERPEGFDDEEEDGAGLSSGGSRACARIRLNARETCV